MPNKLNKSQKEAVKYLDGPLLIIAGAGTGKTTVISEKISYLIENDHAKPEEILALTFTDKAAQEMEERVDELLDLGYVDLQISTFHSFCQRILEEYGLEIGVPDRFNLLSETEAWLLMRKHLYDFNLDYFRPLGTPTRHIHELLNHFSKCKDELISPDDYLEYVEKLKLDNDEVEIEQKTKYKEIAEAYHKYNQLLLDNGALDFADVIYYTVNLVQKRKNVYDALHKRFKYILIDEFQDVNRAQYELVKLLANNAQLTVVGDDDQSIYAFRGSNVSIIMKFKDDFKNSKEIVLTDNYRSGQKILDLAYKSIKNNDPDRLETKAGINKELISHAKVDEKIEFMNFETGLAEAREVVKKIEQIKEEDKDAIWDDFAILVRANSHVDPFIEILEGRGIPYEYLASSGLYRQPIILDCFNFFKLIDLYHESTAVFRLLKLPFFELKENDLQKITSVSKRKKISYYETAKRANEFGLSKEGVGIANKLISLTHSGMKMARHEKPTAVLFDFLKESGYLKYLTHQENLGNREVIRQIYHLKQFFEFLEDYQQKNADANVKGFIEFYSSIMESGDAGNIDQPMDTPDSVNIITVHKAKGLEFKYVFVVNMAEGRFPLQNRKSGIALPDELAKTVLPSNTFHIQEERRLFYVAVTRAKEQLYLTNADQYTKKRKSKISRFMDELGYNTAEKTAKNESAIPYAVVHKEEMEEGEIIYKLPTKYSFSQINNYQRCPYQYKLGNIIGIRTPKGGSLNFGTSIHNTLHKFYKKIQELNGAKQDSLFGLPKENCIDFENGIKAPPLKELLKIFEICWIPDNYSSKEQRDKYYEKGKETLKAFYNKNKDSWTVPVILEGSFKIKLGDYFVGGRIDRVDQLEDGTLEIIDYKTGKAKDKLSIDDKQQLLLYQIAATDLPNYKNIGKVSKLTFSYVQHDKEVSFLGSDDSLKTASEKMQRTLEDINKRDFRATPNKFVCGTCDFRDICEFRAK